MIALGWTAYVLLLAVLARAIWQQAVASDAIPE